MAFAMNELALQKRTNFSVFCNSLQNYCSIIRTCVNVTTKCLKALTAHLDVSSISTSVVTLSKVTLCLQRKSATRNKTIKITSNQTTQLKTKNQPHKLSKKNESFNFSHTNILVYQLIKLSYIYIPLNSLNKKKTGTINQKLNLAHTHTRARKQIM